MARSRRPIDDDEDYRPKRKRRKRGTFPVGVVVLILVVVPLLGVGGYLLYEAVRSTKAEKEAKVEELKKKLIGEWTGEEQGVLANLVVTEGQIVVKASAGGRAADETFDWKVDGNTDNSITLRMTSRRAERDSPIVWEFEFLSDSQVRVSSKSGRKQTSVFTRKGGGSGVDPNALVGNARTLVGTWEVTNIPGSIQGRMLYEFGANGSASMTAFRPDGQSVSSAMQWQVLGDAGNTLKIRMSREGAQEDYDIVFRSNDEIQLGPPNQSALRLKRVK